MKKIYESELHSAEETRESAEIIHVFELESEDEFWKLEDMNETEREEFMGVRSEGGCVMPGAMYRAYDVEVSLHHVVMYERVAWNV